MAHRDAKDHDILARVGFSFLLFAFVLSCVYQNNGFLSIIKRS